MGTPSTLMLAAMRAAHPLFSNKPLDGVMENGVMVPFDGAGRMQLLSEDGSFNPGPRLVYKVDPVNGLNINDGLTWGKAFLTMAKAISVAVAGDTILFTGTIAEATMTLAAANITIRGVDPNYGSSNAGYGSVWMEAAVNAAQLLIVTGKGCRFENITFRGPSKTTAPAGYTTGVCVRLDAAHGTQFIGCRFQGRANSTAAIEVTNASDNVKILGCEFLYWNTATYGHAIHQTTYTADGVSSGWIVAGNRFHSNLNHMVIRLRQALITDNFFPAGGLAAAGTSSATLTVLGIDLHGTNAGYNQVTRNSLGSFYDQACYYGGTNDEWSGNFCVDRSHGTQVDATTGISIVAPAAA
jgi:hypothetical protein